MQSFCGFCRLKMAKNNSEKHLENARKLPIKVMGAWPKLKGLIFKS